MPPQQDLFGPSVLEELEEHNAHFDNLIDMIPARLYVSGNTGDEKYNPKYKKGQHPESKESRRARNKKAKLAKFDPSKSETTLQAKRRKAKDDEELDDDDDESDSENDNIEHDDFDDDEEEEGEEHTTNTSTEKQKSNNKTGNNNSNENDGETTSGLSRIEILRAKLHAKIAQKRASRPEGESNTDHSTAVSKRAARRAEKQRRIEAAKARRQSTYSNAEKTSAKRYKVSEEALGGSKYNADGMSSASVKDDLSGINFGGISGLKETKHYQDNKSLSNVNKKKSLDKLLEEAENKQQRLKELKAGDKEDKEKAAKMEWSDALKEASGERVRNDPAMIKKAMKRKAKKKGKSAEAWKARSEHLKGKLDERQKIRSHNLQQRKQGGSAGANLSRKRITTEDGEGGDKEAGTAGKKRRMGPHAGKSRAGFEGKKQDFINGKNKAKGQAGKSSQ